jgi:hypothetical protein
MRCDDASGSRPSEYLIGGDPITEGRERAAQNRHPCRVPVAEVRREALEEQSCRGGRAWRGGAGRARDIAQGTSRCGQAAREDGGLHCIQVRQLSNIGGDRLEPLGGVYEQRDGVPAPARNEGELRSYLIRASSLEIAAHSRFCDDKQTLHGANRTRLNIPLGCCQRSVRAERPIGRQRDGSLQERCGGGQSSPRTRSLSGALKLGRDLFVRPRRCLGEMPRAPVRISVLVGCLAQRPMRVPSLLRRRRAVHR